MQSRCTSLPSRLGNRCPLILIRANQLHGFRRPTEHLTIPITFDGFSLVTDFPSNTRIRCPVRNPQERAKYPRNPAESLTKLTDCTVVLLTYNAATFLYRVVRVVAKLFVPSTRFQIKSHDYLTETSIVFMICYVMDKISNVSNPCFIRNLLR